MFTVCLDLISGKLLHVYCFLGSLSTVLYPVSIKPSQGQQRPLGPRLRHLEARRMQRLLLSSL